MARERKQTASGVGMIPEPQPVSVTDDGKLTGQAVSYLFGVLLTIIKAFNGYISLGDGSHGSWAGNTDQQYKDALTPSVANTEFTVFHELGRLPVGYDVVRKDVAAHVYDSSPGSWGEDRIMLKCAQPSVTIKLRIF